MIGDDFHHTEFFEIPMNTCDMTLVKQFVETNEIMLFWFWKPALDDSDILPLLIYEYKRTTFPTAKSFVFDDHDDAAIFSLASGGTIREIAHHDVRIATHNDIDERINVRYHRDDGQHIMYYREKEIYREDDLSNFIKRLDQHFYMSERWRSELIYKIRKENV